MTDTDARPHRPPMSRKHKIIGGSCCGSLILASAFFWAIGTMVGPPPEQAAKAPASTAAPETPTAAPEPTTKAATPPPEPTTTAPATPATEASSPTPAATTPAARPGCEPASPALLGAIAGGLKDNSGVDDPAAYPTKLGQGWVKKSSTNDLWYVAAEVPGWNVTGVWVTTAPDGTGTIVSAETSAVSTSDWPDGPKVPRWEPVTGATVDIVIDTKACAA